MPLAKIEVRKSWPPAQVQAIVEAVYLAQREGLKVPEHDRQIRFIEHKSEHFHVPPGKTENYTLIEITIFSGRSIEAVSYTHLDVYKRQDHKEIFIRLLVQFKKRRIISWQLVYNRTLRSSNLFARFAPRLFANPCLLYTSRCV